MNDHDLPPDSEEKIFAGFLQELARRGPEAVEEYARLYPHLANEIRDLAAAQRKLEQALPAPTLPLPERLGEFRIARVIARGGMGEIYEAFDERLKRRVALKTIRQGRISAEMRDRFLREQEILARMHQTHIVPIHAAGEEGGLQYFVMPYIEGVSLHRIVQTLNRLPPEDSGKRTPGLARLVELANPKEARSASEEPGAAVSAPTKLSPAHFRSVAALLANAAEAVHHAHAVGVLHRDLKPGNILVDTAGHCWLIDFGLGGYLNEKLPAGAGGATLPGPATASGVMGTPFYMAPEQFDGKADARTDVWGLGVALYELLALRRPFDGKSTAEVCEQVLRREPERPDKVVGNVPADLAAVCRKAMSKEPGGRYQSAGEMADDLRRWLRGEATLARGAGPIRRVALWSRRNKGWAAAIATVVLASLTLGVMGFVQARRARADLEYAALLAPIEQIRMGSYVGGWSKGAWDLVLKAARHRVDDGLRAQAAATLAGVDADTFRVFEGEQASSVAFDAKGERLLLGGLDNTPARLCERWDKKELRRSRHVGPGPVGFAPDGTPLQLVVDPEDRGRLLLWDVAGQKLRRSFRLPPVNGSVLAMTPDGAFVAACLGGRLIVWQTQFGGVVAESPALGTALALAPDGSHVAVGGEDGRIRVWALPSRKLIADLRGAEHRIVSLAFQRDYRRTLKEGEVSRWLLAAGDTGSHLVVWDLTDKILRTRCLGAEHGVHALAFHPDGSILAGSMVGYVCLWDVATGRPVLRIGTSHLTPGLSFSQDGIRLACAVSQSLWTKDTRILTLAYGRGLRSLQGLDAAVSLVTFSSEGKYLAALSHSWQVAIWSVESGQLLHVLDVPSGKWVDNAGFAFGPNGQFAFVSNTRGTLWQLGPKTAFVRRSWTLRRGLGDQLIFPSQERLILWRREVPGEDRGPWVDLPRVLVARNLLGEDPLKPLAVVRDFNRDIASGAITPDGEIFVAGGQGGAKEDPWYVAAFETAGGKRLWRAPVKVTGPGVAMDPAGTRVAFQDEGRLIVLNTVASGTEIARLPGNGCSLGPPPGRRIAIGEVQDPDRKGFRLIEQHGRGRRLLLLTREESLSVAPSFDRTGRWFAWGNRDGSVMLCDVDEVFRRLEEAGLGWAND